MEREEYLKRRLQLENSKYDQSNSLDRTIITLASGAIGLSLAFIKQLSTIGLKGFLLAALILLGLSLCSVLFSFIASQKAFDEEILKLDNEYESESAKSQKNCWSLITKILNRCSVFFFFFGVFFFFIFVLINLLH